MHDQYSQLLARTNDNPHSQGEDLNSFCKIILEIYQYKVFLALNLCDYFIFTGAQNENTKNFSPEFFDKRCGKLKSTFKLSSLRVCSKLNKLRPNSLYIDIKNELGSYIETENLIGNE